MNDVTSDSRRGTGVSLLLPGGDDVSRLFSLDTRVAQHLI